jgi:hypothetical protein
METTLQRTAYPEDIGSSTGRHNMKNSTPQIVLLRTDLS